MERSLVEGSVFRNLMRFSLPYFLSYFLQTLYGLADLFIIGQFGTKADVTSVSVGSQVMHILTVMIVGLAMGATVTIGRAVGARDDKLAASAVGGTAAVFMAGSVVLTAALLLLRTPVAQAMATPAQAMDGTVRYLTVCFAGIPFITAYNVISSILRGLGDSKSPMYFIAAACAVNIGLDCLFMGALGLGPAGAALGTVISQAVSVALALAVMLRKKGGVKLSREDFAPKRAVIGTIMRIGVPVALQDGFIQLAFIVITIIANKRGLDDAAAVGIVEKVISMLFLVPSSMLSAVSALAAQNFGAGKPERARKTLLCAMAVTVGFGTVVAIAVQFAAGGIVGLFERDEAVIRLGGQYLRSYVADCVFAGVHFCFSGYFCALEKSWISFLHNVISIVCARVPLSFAASALFPDTLFPMGLAAPAGSLLSVIVCVVAYILLRRNEKRGAQPTK